MGDIKQLLQDNKSWPFELSREILKSLGGKTPKKGYVLFETGYGPSGLPHIGTYCEVVRTQMVKNAFEMISDIPTKLVVVSDDMDGMRKIPDNIPNPDSLKSHIQKPLTNVPDPFGEEKSYGDYMNKKLRNFLDDFGFDYEFYSATSLYKMGWLDEFLLRTLEQYDKIMSVMLPTLGEERQQTYSPFLPICPRTGKVLYVPIIKRDVEKGMITYSDPETNEEVTVPVTGGHCKLQWKPDFGMRWAALDVNFEMFGKDHRANAVLYRQICHLIGGKGPVEFVYEMFLDEHGKKISKSKGNGVSIDEWLKYAPIESLSFYMYQTPTRAKKMYFSVIPKSVDEYITFVEKFHQSEEVDRFSNPVWHVHGGKVPKYELGGITFSLLLNLASVCNSEDKSVFWSFISQYGKDLNPKESPFLDKLVGYAIQYYKDFIKPKKVYIKPSEQDKLLLENIKVELIQLDKDCAPEDIQSIFYRTGTESKYDNLRDFFKMVYQVLLGQEQGPRFGSFIKLYGIDKTIELIETKLGGKMPKIKNIVAREILDSRGNPTVEVDVFIGERKFARAASPSGASVGIHEAHELRDGDPEKFFGKGVEKAVNNVNTVIRSALIGKDCLDQKSIDKLLLGLDGTKTRSVLGANAIVATSMAVLKAAALSQKKSLFSYINGKAHTLPVPMINIINGGAHADNALDIQEFIIMPVGANSIRDAVRMGSEVFSSLRSVLSSKNLSTSVGDEGGFAPDIKYDKDAIELILRAIEKAGYKAGKDIMLALDVAATELYKDGNYYFEGIGKSLTAGQLVSYYEELSREYPIYSIEDGMAEEDYEGWAEITHTLGDKMQLVGDDVFVTNKAMLSKCITKKIGNAALIKPNQVGTVTETFETIKLAHSKGYECVMSHRSGETEDVTISHLAVAMGCSQIKVGSVCRVDRTAKYNELMRIAEELGASAKYRSLKQFNKVLT